MFVDGVLVNGPAIRRQTHELVLPAIDLETAIIGESRIEQSKRMREMQVVGQADFVAFADAIGGGAPFADTVESENGRLVKRAGEERAGRMAFMMIQKD